MTADEASAHDEPPRSRSGRCRRPLRRAALTICAVLAVPQPAFASAFFIREQSATAMANAFAGATAGADDVSYIFYNGAAAGRLSGSSVASVGTVIWSQVRFHAGSATTAAGSRVGGSDGGRNGGTTALVPATYVVWDLHDTFPDVDDVKLSMAINAPFGLETEYEQGWIGRYHGLQSRLRTIDVNPGVAWEAVPGLTLAVGLQAQYIDAKLTNAVDFGSLGAAAGLPFAVPGAQDGFAELKGDDWGWGWTAGLLYEPVAGTRIGIGYRSAVEHEIEGDARFRLDGDGVGALLAAASGAFADTSARAKLTTPEVVSVGGYHQIDDAWAVMAEATWTGWSRYRNLRVHFDNPSQPNDVTEQDWRDTWFFAAGTTWRPDPEWTLRMGVGYDQSPVRNRTRTPRTPANNGVLLAAGATWQPLPEAILALGYSHFFIESPRFDLKADSPGNAARGGLSGRAESSVDALSLQFTWTF